MRVVLDTNVWISGLLWGGIPGKVFELLGKGRHAIVVTPAILFEIVDVLNRPKCQAALRARKQSATAVLQHIRTISTLVRDTPSPISLPADPDDEVIVAASLAGRADVIVSGDHHLLDIGVVKGIKILTPAEFLRWFR